jgi:hypothetical protein
MVLNELGQKISAALAKVANAEIVDDALLDLCLKDISTALLQADVNVKQVRPNILPTCVVISPFPCHNHRASKLEEEWQR